MEEDKYVDQVKYCSEAFGTFTLQTIAIMIVSAALHEVAISWGQCQVSPRYHLRTGLSSLTLREAVQLKHNGWN